MNKSVLYIIRRFFFYCLAGFMAVTLNFIIPRLMPGDPASIMFAQFKGKLKPEALDALKETFGFADGPIILQYFDYLKHLLSGDFGLSISYSKFLKKNIINLKIKPYYESIQSTSSIGVDLDIMLYKKFNNINLIAGINDLISYKKWNTGVIENNKLNYFISTSVLVNNLGLFIEANSLYKENIGFEYNHDDTIFIRFATNVDENFSYGLAFNLDAIELSYAYVPIDKIIGNLNQLSLSFKILGLQQLKGKLKP